MQEVTLKFSNERARDMERLFRKQYDRPHMGLEGLCKIALHKVFQEARETDEWLNGIKIRGDKSQ